MHTNKLKSFYFLNSMILTIMSCSTPFGFKESIADVTISWNVLRGFVFRSDMTNESWLSCKRSFTQIAPRIR